MTFQTFVNTQPAPALAGDFAARNPRHMVLAGPGGLVAGPQGLNTGLFAWFQDTTLDLEGAPTQVNNFGSGPVAGFVHREQQALIQGYLQIAGVNIPEGFPVSLCSVADLWVVNNGTTEALFGQTCYAAYATGQASFAAANTPGTFTATAAIAAGTPPVFTGSISGNLLTVTAVASGTIEIGGVLTGTGTGTNNTITGQQSGTTGGVGVYFVSIPEETVVSETMGETFGVMTVSVAGSGNIGVGDAISGSGVTAGTIVTALGTGAGGVGTYIVNLTQTASSTTITAGLTVATKWFAASAGAPGELVKITPTPLG